jgi:hypothetical protein
MSSIEIKLPENCENFSKTNKCHKWLKESFKKNKLSKEELFLLPSEEQKKAIQICSKCPYYKRKSDIIGF